MSKLVVTTLSALFLGVGLVAGGGGLNAAMAADQNANTVQNTGQATVSGQTLSVLQPASSSTSGSALQPADAGSGGVAQPGTQDIQQSGSASQVLDLIAGEADQPHKLDQNLTLTWLGYILIVMASATALTAVVWLFQRRRWLPLSLPV